MVTDSHCHLDPELPADRLLAAMDAGGIDRAVLIAAAQEPIGKIGRAGPAFFRGCMAMPALRMPMYRVARRAGGLVPLAQPENGSVYAVARAHSDRFIPFAFLNPRAGADDELDRALAEGARGVKLHAWFHGFRLPEALPVLKRCAENDLPVIVHLGFGPASDVEHVLDEVPSLKLVVAHAGLPLFGKLWTTPRVFFDVAAPQLVSRRVIRRLLQRVGPGRVLFGSDAPIGIRSDGTHRYDPPPLPDRAMGANVESLLG